MVNGKQTNSILVAFGLFISMLLTLLSVGVSNVQAYNCFDANNPGDLYEYHESDGMCWKIRYTDRQQDPPIATCNNGACACPNGLPFAANGSGACKQTCSTGDQYHADNNSCWYKNGYTSQETQKIAPTNNDGTTIAAANATCTDNYVYLPTGNGKTGPGCYIRAGDGSFPCAPDQGLKTSGAHGQLSQDCTDATKTHLVPKNKQQSADKTKVNEECAKKYPGDDQQEQRTICQTASNNPNINCAEQSNQQKKEACETGRKSSVNQGTPPNNNNETGSKCGEADTVLIACKGTGVQAIGDVLRIGISVLTVLIGIAATGGLAWAAILYAKAEDNASNVSEAKEMIRNVVIGIIVYGFLIAIVNWLVPGGVIG
jgi:hypothetical protein